jgi:hypothetical protein
VVEVDHVDRLDRGVGVGVRRQQHPAGEREQVHRLLQELDPGHLRHPVVGQQQRDRLTAQLQLAQRLQRLRSGLGPDDPVLLAVPAAKIAGNRPGHPRIVVHGDDHRAGSRRCHGSFIPAPGQLRERYHHGPGIGSAAVTLRPHARDITVRTPATYCFEHS